MTQRYVVQKREHNGDLEVEGSAIYDYIKPVPVYDEVAKQRESVNHASEPEVLAMEQNKAYSVTGSAVAKPKPTQTIFADTKGEKYQSMLYI